MSQHTASATRERPILFSGPMVRAILGGEKTQTRRVITAAGWLRRLEESEDRADHAANLLQIVCGCPYGIEGDRLWVRETFGRCGCGTCRKAWPRRPEPNAETHQPHGVLYQATHGGPSGISWRPSIHMPRWASRLTLEITDVRIERIQDIGEDDAKAEGAPAPSDFRKPLPFYDGRDFREAASHRDVFRCLWNAINGARGHSWSVNPWVWVLSFRRVV